MLPKRTILANKRIFNDEAAAMRKNHVVRPCPRVRRLLASNSQALCRLIRGAQVLLKRQDRRIVRYELWCQSQGRRAVHEYVRCRHGRRRLCVNHGIHTNGSASARRGQTHPSRNSPHCTAARNAETGQRAWAEFNVHRHSECG